MVVVGASGAPVPCLRGEGRLSAPSPSKVMWNSLVESPVMACSEDSGPQRVEPMAAAFETSIRGERFRPPKKSAMNSRLPNRMVSPREKPSHDRHSTSVVMVIADEGTIRTSGRKARYKSPFLARQLSVFSTPSRTGWSRSRVPVLRWSCELQST
jgi:hypothetical protein